MNYNDYVICKKKKTMNEYEIESMADDKAGVLRLDLQIKGKFHKDKLDLFYIDCKKQVKILKYFSNDLIRQCLKIYKEWLMVKISPSIADAKTSKIDPKNLSMIDAFNTFMKERSVFKFDSFQLTEKYHPVLSKIDFNRLKKEIDDGEFDRSSLAKKAPEYGVSKSTLHTAIKKVLGYRFKSEDPLNNRRNLITKSDVMKLFLFKRALLVDDSHICIYIDESNFDSHRRQRKGWVHRSVKAVRVDFGRIKSVNLIVALTNSRMVHHYITYTRNKSKDFVEFLRFMKKKVMKKKKLMDALKKYKITLIMDNASIHKTKLVKEFIRDNDFNVLFLPPYHPHHNNAEMCFMLLKKMFYRNDYKDR